MSRHWSTRAAVVALFMSAPLAAQRALPDTSIQNTTSIGIVPTVVLPNIASERASLASHFRADTSIDMRAHAANVAAGRAISSGEGSSRGPAMMIVGGAAILVGAVVGGNGGTTIAVGGAVLGLVGLWNYLK